MTAPGIHQVIVRRGRGCRAEVLLHQLQHHFSYMAEAC